MSNTFRGTKVLYKKIREMVITDFGNVTVTGKTERGNDSRIYWGVSGEADHNLLLKLSSWFSLNQIYVNLKKMWAVHHNKLDILKNTHVGENSVAKVKKTIEWYLNLVWKSILEIFSGLFCYFWFCCCYQHLRKLHWSYPSVKKLFFPFHSINISSK